LYLWEIPKPVFYVKLFGKVDGMKQLRFLYIVLGIWLSFTGIATAKADPIFKKITKERTCTKTILADIRLLPVKTYILKNHLKNRKDSRINAKCRSGIKKKATPREILGLFKISFSQLITLKHYGSRANYGLTALYQVTLHSYLHLYQLF
jgi:hypothetical protein